MSALYFAYGSNLSSDRLMRRLGDVVIVGRATLRDHLHRFNKHGNDDTAKGNVERRRGHRVLGALYQIEPGQLAELERIESGYQRAAVVVESVAGAVTAHTFRAVRLADGLSPTREYLEHYERGAAEHGIAPAYLREILPAWYWTR